MLYHINTSIPTPFSQGERGGNYIKSGNLQCLFGKSLCERDLGDALS